MSGVHPLVGVWRVKTIGAPFAYHMFVFHSDGTMQQSNPAEGNKDTSDSAGMGVWADRNGRLRVHVEEYRVDYTDGSVTRGVIEFELKLTGNRLAGGCTFTVHDPETGALVHGPHKATLTAERVALD